MGEWATADRQAATKQPGTMNRLTTTLLLPLLLIACGEGDRDAAGADDAHDREVATELLQGDEEPTPDEEGSEAIAEREPGDESIDSFDGTVMELAGGEMTSGEVRPVLVDVRSGHHEGYDRVVFEFSGDAAPEWTTEYIDRPTHECGSGKQRYLAGAGWLQIHFEGTAAHTEEMEATIENRDRALSLPNLQQLTLTCDYEGNVIWVLGLELPSRYRVVELKNPTRVVIDVQHS